MTQHSEVTHREATPEPSFEDRPGLVNKLRLGKLAGLLAGVEVVTAATSVASGNPLYVELSPLIDLALVGIALRGVRRYFHQGFPKSLVLMHSFIKDKPTEPQPDYQVDSLSYESLREVAVKSHQRTTFHGDELSPQPSIEHFSTGRKRPVLPPAE